MISRSEVTDVAEGTITVAEWNTEPPPGTYTVWVDGTQTEQRPLTPDEQEALTEQETVETSASNTTQLVDESAEAVDKLVLVVENLNAITDMTNASINQNPAAVIKDLARECKTIARQANREARLTSGKTDSTFTGEEVP